MTAGFHHITFVSGDIGRTERFYRDLLGLQVVARLDPGAADGTRLWLAGPEARPGMLIRFREEPGRARGRWGVGGIHHLALATATPALLLMWKRWLTDAGVPVTGPYDRGWFHSIYFTDPDGQVLEIATKGPGYDLDEPMHALGTSVIMPKQSQMPGGRDEEAIRARTWPEPIAEISPPMTLDGIHHITGITDDVEAVGRFYERTLGLRVIKKSVNQDDAVTPHWFWASYDGRSIAPHSSLTMFGWLRRHPVARPGPGQTHGVTFRAADQAELQHFRGTLLDAGVAVSEVRDHGAYRGIAFEAPDGLAMEIATDGPGFEASSAAAGAMDEPEARS